MSLRVRVVSEGNDILGTRIYDADTGKELDTRRVAEIRYVHRLGSLPRVEVVLLGMPADVVGTLETAEARALRYLQAIERADHPDAGRDPVGALGQAAVDFKTALMLRRPNGPPAAIEP